MITVPIYYFRDCAHYIGAKNDSEPFDESKEVCVCKAFPNGIPDDIAYGDNLHDKPVEGDNGIQFEKESK